jgi:amino acid efflux transporter
MQQKQTQKQNEARKATIGLPQAIALYIGAVLGSGVLLVPGIAAEMAGPASLMAWGLMTIVVLPMALCMGLLSAKYPHSGGVSYFVTKAFGEHAGQLVGWFFLMSVPIGAPIASLTGAGYLTTALGLGENSRIAITVVMLAAAIFINWLGMKVAGNIQVIVITAIVAVLVITIVAAFPQMQVQNLSPFLPNGWMSVGKAAAILFWCFIGWEAVSHLSEEFVNPEREAIKGVTIADCLVGILYFLTALATVATHSYGVAGKIAMVEIVKGLLGHAGALMVGITGVFVCLATIIAYIGAASRLACALAAGGAAPSFLGIRSEKYQTPTGGLVFLGVAFVLVLGLYASGVVSLTTLIQFPNATFILTYLGGCAAGTRLLRENKWGVRISWISLLITAAIFPFVGWSILYPLLIAIVLWLVKKLVPKEYFDHKTHINSL